MAPFDEGQEAPKKANPELAPFGSVGAHLLINDMDHRRAHQVAEMTGGQIIPSADRLRQKGILYAPDFVADSGGVLCGLSGR